MAIEELLRRVKASEHHYPDIAKAQIFISGLRPDLAVFVAFFLLRILSATLERARLLKMLLSKTWPILMPLLSLLFILPSMYPPNTTFWAKFDRESNYKIDRSSQQHDEPIEGSQRTI
ncbi:5481_t:CDS:1 [Dentiscutata heterogama]|uniref:5481_t:CDS:1 n=1 Tax=Dentiscutata heterogama TaxID=1316150 RepID=A0ACA9KNI5_9GLOM|nr:5481_t:CDS:1 [Dentiscutata heterogama]